MSIKMKLWKKLIKAQGLKDYTQVFSSNKESQ